MASWISDGGIGTGIARRFADAGSDVALLYRSAEVFAKQLTQELRAAGVSSRAYRCDLTSESDVEETLETVVSDVGQLSAVANNAGVQPTASLPDMSLAEWQAVMEANMSSAFLVTKEAANHMTPGGAVINVASIEGNNAAVNHAHYCASKAAVLMHARAAAVEYGSLGLRINTVSPGLVDRPGLRDNWPEGVERWRARAPLSTLASASDIGDACVFLASPLAKWISGTDLIVDGGVSACSPW